MSLVNKMTSFIMVPRVRSQPGGLMMDRRAM